jgi:hypothetical protein
VRNSTGWEGIVSKVVEEMGMCSGTYKDLVFACVVGRVFEVHADQVASELAVGGLLYAVEDQVDQVESAQECGRQVDVLGDWQIRVVLAADGVG